MENQNQENAYDHTLRSQETAAQNEDNEIQEEGFEGAGAEDTDIGPDSEPEVVLPEEDEEDFSDEDDDALEVEEPLDDELSAEDDDLEEVESPLGDEFSDEDEEEEEEESDESLLE